MLLDVEVIKAKAKSKKVEESAETPRKKLPVKINKPVSTDDVFADFFKSLGL